MCVCGGGGSGGIYDGDFHRHCFLVFCLLSHVLLIYLRCNDLGLMKVRCWLSRPSRIRSTSNKCGQKWSWYGQPCSSSWFGEHGDLHSLDRLRHKANQELKKALEARMGFYLPHPDLQIKEGDLYHADDIHFSDKGNHIFLPDLRQGLKVVLCCQSG